MKCGIAALFIVSSIDPVTQISGIGITILIAAITGTVSGEIISVFSRRSLSYDNSEEFDL